MTNKIKIIGITGKKYSGKDTLGNFFVNNYGYIRLAFADPLKEAVKCIFGLDDEQLYGNKKEEIDEFWGKNPRQILQFVGTDLFRNHTNELIPNIEKNIWTLVIKRKIINELNKNPNAKFIITDTRFPNEINLIKEFGGIIIKLKRTNIINNDNHESESLIDELDFNYEFQNNDTKEKLFENVISSIDNFFIS